MHTISLFKTSRKIIFRSLLGRMKHFVSAFFSFYHMWWQLEKKKNSVQSMHPRVPRSNLIVYSEVGVGKGGVLLGHGAETLDGVHELFFVHILKSKPVIA